MINRMKKLVHLKTVIGFMVAALLAGGLAACSVTDSDVASRNISTDADNFKIIRRIVFINGITDQYLLEITGKCSITDDGRQLEVTCKTGTEQNPTYIKHFLGLSDNVTYLAEQLEGADVSTNFYKISFKPLTLIPNPELN